MSALAIDNTTETTDATSRDSDESASSDGGSGCTDDNPPESIRIELTLETSDVAPSLAGWLEPQLKRIIRLAGLKNVSLSIAVVDDEQMSQLHEQYKNVTGTTDVLTFDLCDDESELDVDGEVIICADVAQRQAVVRGHETRLELLLYAVHGLLHLSGYDDLSEADALRMHAREDELLTKAGFDPVYNHGQEFERR